MYNNLDQLSKTSPILKELNQKQLEAVTTTEGYIRVIAGAGSGKTRALTSRFAYIVEYLGVMPSNILCVTFTNKASQEMKKRIRYMIGDLDLGKITTFHGFCVQVLREEHNFIQFPTNFLILDDDDTDSILSECFEKLNITNKQCTFSKAKKYITSKKNKDDYTHYLSKATDEELTQQRENSIKVEEKIFYEFLFIQRKIFGLDFDDLILLTFYLLDSNEEIRTKWQKRMQYIMVDEFQDVSCRQYALVQILSEYHKNLFVVGDPDQTIYSWRGANISNIINFDKVFVDSKTIMMNQNYRSFKEIITTTNTLIQKNTNRMEKSLVPARDGAGVCVYFHGKTSKEESEWVGTQIKNLVNFGAKYSDIAILYRAHYASRPIEEHFLNESIPYLLYSGTAFYQRKEIKDVVSYLRMIIHADDISFLRVINEPKRGIGKKRIEFLKRVAYNNNCSLYQALEDNEHNSNIAKNSVSEFLRVIENFQLNYNKYSLTDLVSLVLNQTGYEEYLRTSGEDDRLDNLSNLKQAIYEFEITAGEKVTLDDYLEHISLFTNLDQTEKEDAVKLMTIHTAKGLEFPYVFVTSLSEGVFPAQKTHTKEQLEEERRLAYVAFTRAEEKLFLSDSEGHTHDGAFRYPSRFIFNCDEVNLNYVVELPQHLRDTAKLEINRKETRLNNDHEKFKVGDKFEHFIQGKGEILEICDDKGCYVVKYYDIDTVRNLAFTAKTTKI